MPKPRVSKQDLPYRWFILILSIASSFGVEYSFDNPAVLKDILAQQFESKLSPAQFELYYSFLYSSLAVPNVIVPFIIGNLIDSVRN
jgi:hypothetical protein